jgi:hypothetical protein
MISLEKTPDGAIVTILGSTPDEAELEVSWAEGSKHLFVRQEQDDGSVDLLALTPLQAAYLSKVLNFSVIEHD